MGDSAGAHLLGLYTAFCTNPAYTEEYDIRPPKGFVPTAIALNCGPYVIDMKGNLTDGLTKDLMLDLLPEKGTEEELLRINVVQHVTPAYPPMFFMTCNDDFLRNQAPLLAAKLAECEVPFVYRFYSDAQAPLRHVFHCSIRTEAARRCNDEECDFFRSFL